MRIAKVEKIEDAYEYLRPYTILNGVIYTPLEKQIKEVFIGICDWGVSYSIYTSRFGQYPPHDFTPDLGDLFLWAIFYDNSLKLVSELYDDPEIVEVLKGGTLTKTVIIKTDYEWSAPVKIIRGLDVIIWLNQPEGHFEVQCKDVPNGIERILTIQDMGYKERLNI